MGEIFTCKTVFFFFFYIYNTRIDAKASARPHTAF